ncbi:MAG: glycosyltransferase family 4 protein [bacterium]|nr:glycosyltransferase family 4 protein [bacterium]
MKFFYLTSKTYPASTADHVYVRELARGFAASRKDDFTLVVANDKTGELNDIPHLNLRLPFTRLRSLFYLIWFPFFLYGPCARGKDAVFFMNDQNLLSIAIFWRKIIPRRYTVIADWHMLSSTWRDRFAARGSDLSITTSLKLKHAVSALAAPKRVETVYGGVDLRHFRGVGKAEARRKLGLPLEKKMIAYVGGFKTMGMDKGLSTMIESLKFLPSNVVAFFAGGKENEIKEYRAFAEKERVSGRVLIFGRYEPNHVGILAAAADILVIPYPDQPHFRKYGFPMKVYEYMAASRPVVYSKLELAEEVIGDVGYPFAPGDPAALAEAVEYAFLHEKESEERGTKARTKVEAYTWEEKAKRILSLLEK